MEHRLAIMLDGEYVRKVIRKREKRDVTVGDVQEEVNRILRSPELQGHELFRVFFYTANPLTGKAAHPMGGEPYDFDRRAGVFRRLIDSIDYLPDFAVRRGELLHQGWELKPEAVEALSKGMKTNIERDDLTPRVNQKGVDLRIGLDIACLALKRLVTEVVVVTADSDMVPAMKLARREGLRVYLYMIGEKSVRPELKIHADRILGAGAATTPPSS